MNDYWDRMMEDTIKREQEREKRAKAPVAPESPTKTAERKYHSPRPVEEDK
jgi:hypothetical protein